ncbi:hypothetical protein OH77DRAFT_1436778 [Trametes cingulata]|nr:hypothetical protein OH77DRAFT_1436778 [Trametes cingulata]
MPTKEDTSMPPHSMATTVAPLGPMPVPVPTRVPETLHHAGSVFPDLTDVPPDIIERLLRIINYAAPDASTYSVGLIPATANWGRGPNERVLCENGHPITIFMSGRVRTFWFYDMHGDPQPRVNIGVTLITPTDLDAVKQLYTRAKPRSAPSSDIIYASKRHTVRERGERAPQAVPFEEVYDASERLTSKSTMPRISAAEIADNDIVVVECHFTRWKKAAEGKRKLWSSWDVGFDLVSISILYSSPPPLEPASPPRQAPVPLPVFAL